MASKNYLICEPCCKGLEHASINAALLTAFHVACPESNIHFFADKDHIDCVKELIGEKSKQFFFNEIKILEKNIQAKKRFKSERRLVSYLFNEADRLHIQHIIFFCATSSLLWALKLSKSKRYKISVILHGALETIKENVSFSLKRFRSYFFHLKTALRCLRRKNLTYFVLGDYIRGNLIKLIPSLESHIFTIDLPYVFDEQPECCSSGSSQIIFGSIGAIAAWKNSSLFFDLSQYILSADTKLKARFAFLGYLADDSLTVDQVAQLSLCGEGQFEKALSSQEMKKQLSMIDYAVFLYSPNSYILTASGAVLDAFSFGKPIIALRTPLFEYLFKKMGDIGYLCNTYEEVKSTVLGLLQDPDHERYIQQKNQILTQRHLFSPEAVALQIRASISCS